MAGNFDPPAGRIRQSGRNRCFDCQRVESGGYGRSFILGRHGYNGGDGEATRPGAHGDWVVHNGILPCFLGGSEARLVMHTSNALQSTARVRLGSITSSM